MGYKFKYPHIPLLVTMRPTPRILLGRRLFWTEKKDGECVTIWLREKDNKVCIASRNQEDANQDIKHRVTTSEDYPKVLKLLEQHPQFVCYVEECKKGRSITGAEEYDRTYLFLFDIYDKKAEYFLNYVAVHQHAYHHKIPIVGLFAETRHRSMKDLLKFRNHALKHCEAVGLEGMVIKPRNYIKDYGYIQAKVKLDVPEPKQKKISKGQPIYPPIPENEILGAVNKAHQELGDKKFKEIRLAMPLIAQYVGEECKKHFYSSPKGKLIIYYREYLERMVK